MIITKEEMIQRVKDCGQELIENAANIVNDFRYETDLTITCYLSWDEDGTTPRISIDTEIIPERFVKRLQAMDTQSESELKNTNISCDGCVYEDVDGSTEDMCVCVSCNRMNDFAKNDFYKTT